MTSALHAADQLLDELATPARELPAPTMGRLAKVRYTHKAMADEIIANPAISQNDLAGVFGFTPAWVSNVLASDAFQSYLASRKDELIDPVLRMTIEERFKALVQRSLEVLQEKLAKPASVIPDNLALQAAALGARSLGLGRTEQQAAAPSSDRLQHLATRLVVLQREVRTQVEHGQVIQGEVSETVYDSGGAPPVGGQKTDAGQSA